MNLDARNVILYVEDDEDDQQLVQDHLKNFSADIDVIIKDNGVDAITYLNSLPEVEPAPCLIILDINMPKMNGLEALKHIRKIERFAKTPVILFTTSSQSSDKNVATEYKAEFITKPLDSKQMKSIVQKFIHHCDQNNF